MMMLIIILHGSVLLASRIHFAVESSNPIKEYVVPVYRAFNSCSSSSSRPNQEIKTLEYNESKA